MYSVQVETTENAATTSTRGDGEGEVGVEEAVEFSLGNPRVEHITGVIHLFRCNPDGQELDHSSRVCVLAVPADVGVQEFCLYCGPYLKLIKDMRFLRRDKGRSTVYLVCLQFEDEETAQSFVSEYNGKPELEFNGGTTPRNRADTELPTCPVCLERLDQEISGVITTVCNHVFHKECLRKWGDTSCPVCRYCMQSQATSRCSTCNAQEDLWICLICGHVGCGRYKARHAFDHWQDTQHCYALELDTQRVWDYAGDGYVHRLIQSRGDGKLVEVPAPVGECSGSHAPNASTDLERKQEIEKNEAVVASKLDAVAFEYNHLLTAQLESQRQYFEGLLRQAKIESDAKIGSIIESARQKAEEMEQEAKESSKMTKAAVKKVSDANSKVKKLSEEVDFLRSLNDTLISNQAQWQKRLKGMEEELEKVKAEKDSQMKDHEEQVRDLMVFIEAQRTIGGQEDVVGGSVVGVSDPGDSPSQKGKRRNRPRR